MTFQSDYPGAIVVEAARYGYQGVYADPVNRPRGFVLHTPEEEADDHMVTPYYFATTDRDASTHYFVSYHGFVIQCVPENEGAYGNTVVGKPFPAWADRPNLNLCSLNVEIEGYAATIANTISPAQKTALVNLIRDRCQAHGIPIDRQHIIGHYEVATNRSDPGTLDIDALVAALQTPEEDALKLDAEDQQFIRGLVYGSSAREAQFKRMVDVMCASDDLLPKDTRYEAVVHRLQALETNVGSVNQKLTRLTQIALGLTVTVGTILVAVQALQ